MTRITLQEVCARLCVDRSTLTRWHSAGHLRRELEGAYSITEINRFLAACALGFDRPPTWQDIRSGRLALLSVREAAEVFGFGSERTLLQFAEQHAIPRIKFPGTNGRNYYHAAAMGAVLEPSSKSVSGHVVMRATGYANIQFHRNIPELELVHNPRARTTERQHFTTESFMKYLRAHLPFWVEPTEWLDEVSASGENLVPLQTVAEKTNMPLDSVQEIFERYKISYIRRKSAGRKPEMALTTALWQISRIEKVSKCDLYDVAGLFDVKPRHVAKWSSGEIPNACPLGHWHTPEEPYWRKICWLAYLQKTHSGGASPGQIVAFWAGRMIDRDCSPLMSVAQASRSIRRTSLTVLPAIKKGWVPAIKTPTGVWRIPASWLDDFRACLES